MKHNLITQHNKKVQQAIPPDITLLYFDLMN